MQDNKATLTASKHRCWSLQEALEGSTLVYVKCVHVSYFVCGFLHYVEEAVHHTYPFFPPAPRFSCGIHGGRERERETGAEGEKRRGEQSVSH